MISVNFTNDIENIVATEHLYQWDNGQKLSISGVGTTADIHFANKKSEKALVITPTVTSGAMEAPIPNSLLAEPYPIIAYVYVPSDDGARTIKTITIFVEARKQPSDYVIEEDEGVTTLETISQRANEVLQNATNQINTAVSNMQTDYTNFKNTIQGELDDMVANTTIPNADTVDGKHASDIMNMEFNFSNRASITKGDLNNYTTAGAYVVLQSISEDTLVNQPFYNTGYYLNVYRRSVTFVTQIAMTWNGLIKIRFYSEGKWHDWKNIADGGNANTANTANTAGTLATTPTNVCLRNISFGTANPQVTDSNAEGYVAEGALYGQYT